MTNLPSNLRGLSLIYDPRWNKGTGFSEAERDALGLRGLLPPRALTMEEQLLRVRNNFDAKPSDIEKYIFLVGLQDRNETLFYRLVLNHLQEMLPLIYTPTVGDACKRFGHIFRRARGLYVSIKDRGRIKEVLRNWTSPVSVIVVTDGERILGLGDLGAHGMGIPIGKLSLYTACAGVPPFECLPITLDVGTDNESLRNDPLYTGLYQPRVRGAEYDAFIEEFVTAVEEVFPDVLLQWEDFATENAITLLGRYRNRLCTFNDDIQGTAGVVLAALLSACRSTRPLVEQRLLFFGAGASATGVANLIVSAMMRDGLSEADARARCWFVDSKGLVVAERTDLAAHKRPYAHQHARVATLLDAVRELKPTGLIGLSTQPQTFTEEVLKALAAATPRPIVFALSNPTSKSECTAEQAYRFTGGKGLFASGSPFDPVTLNGVTYLPSQANNAYIFPGLGLGIVLSKARRVTDGMFHAAAHAAAHFVTEDEMAQGALLPHIDDIREVSAAIAVAVIRLAKDEGLATAPIPEDIDAWVRGEMYQPDYVSYV